MSALSLDAAWLLPAAVTLVATWLLAALAPRLGWVDAGDGGRKTQRVPLRPVGGVALALGLLVVWALADRDPFTGEGLAGLLHFLDRYRPASPEVHVSMLPPPGAPPERALIPGSLSMLPALGLALVVGLVDDRKKGGLRPLAKLAGQTLAGCAVAWPWLVSGEPAFGLALVLAAVVVLNAVNTFDNADGAVAGLALVAFVPLQPLVAAAVAGFLPFNLRRHDGRALVGRLPHASLGDAGSHLIGMLILVTPAAWPVLALPLLDLARVAIERMRAGQRPWVGDRRHLAHRLQGRGLPPLAVALVLALLALPGMALDRAAGLVTPELVRLGVALTAALFALAVVLTRAPRPRTAGAAADRAGLGQRV